MILSHAATPPRRPDLHVRLRPDFHVWGVGNDHRQIVDRFRHHGFVEGSSDGSRFSNSKGASDHTALFSSIALATPTGRSAITIRAFNVGEKSSFVVVGHFPFSFPSRFPLPTFHRRRRSSSKTSSLSNFAQLENWDRVGGRWRVSSREPLCPRRSRVYLSR